MRVRPFGLIAIASMPRLFLTVGVSPIARNGLFGDFNPPGNGIGAWSSFPLASKCRIHGPNSSPTHRSPLLPRWIDSGSMSPPVS